MDGTTLQAKINSAYAKAAQKVGLPYSWYRGGLISPISSQNLLGTLDAAFSIDRQFQSVPNYSTMLWRAFLDISQATPGDILVAAKTFVLLESGPLIPPMAIMCTDQITIQRPSVSTSAGLQAYNDPGFTLIAQGLPANVNIKKEVGDIKAHLPGDIGRQTYWNVSFYGADGSVKDGDIVTDGEGYRYQVTSANWQSIYYQCLCQRLES
ncbi:MAG: hypothetical protein ACYC0Z_13120 [Acidobacteriaceae bacterium]